jgi:lipooligosaccharide transport system permease protein
LASTVLFPIFYLAAFGVGVNKLVTAHIGLVQGQTYLHFIAPTLLATTTMQLGEGESLWPVLAAIKWIRSYHAAVATPMEPEDILYGKLAWVVTRAFATGVIYSIVIACFGALQSWWSLTLPFIGALITLAFAAPLVAFAATAQSDGTFTTLYRFGFVPMFLFSATFYPLSAYPGYLRPLVQIVPLYHGVALTRAAAFGEGSPGAILCHIGFLVVMAVLGVLWGRHTMRRRLVD